MMQRFFCLIAAFLCTLMPVDANSQSDRWYNHGNKDPRVLKCSSTPYRVTIRRPNTPCESNEVDISNMECRRDSLDDQANFIIECKINDKWVSVADMLEEKRKADSQNDARRFTTILTPNAKTSNKHDSIFTKNPAQNAPPGVLTYQVKDRWISVDIAEISDENGASVGSYGFGTEVSIYAEKLGYAKVDLAKERWVRLDNLSNTKPLAKASLEKTIGNKDNSQSLPPPTVSSLSTKAKPESANDLIIRDKPYYVRYVSSTSLNERSYPKGPVVNKVYRGQLLRVYGSKGEWYRVTPKSSTSRYVHSDYLSVEKPKLKPKSSIVFKDSRIESSALPTRAGQYGASAYDVETLWMGARVALNKGICGRIQDGDKSIKQSGKYYLNCGGSKNKFFRRSGNSIIFD